MQKLLINLLLLLIIPNSFAINYKLPTKATQGQLIIGIAPVGTIVKFAGKTQIVKSNKKYGKFPIGISRDHKKIAVIKLIKNNKTYSHKINIHQRKYDIQKINGIPSKKVTPPKSYYERIGRESKEIKNSRINTTEKKYYTRKWIHPTHGIITGVYGSQRYFNGKPRRPHLGIDIANKRGTPVYAPQKGVVRLAQKDNYFSGHTLIIDHGNHINTSFIHLHKMLVKEGDYVKQGDIIGTMGSTGRSTGPHLDWRINWHSIKLDPALLDGVYLGLNPKGKKIKLNK